ncbi:fumarate/nitrate reduction transcriptional regulator Fnr [Trinickia dinghuensis]|uniref:Fumarate/nitrate reduction transcriptional regulator Fnr n=1 Tax=Trinickia dinghuensis TaxID=2291023 RepID=A0A3D8K358_9BURK|nr:fumarate/nitrate reduction transcriptional regulator Fnr [Trinickia dinghuensis]RDU99284.1 fumarate/nitrate reduction transcriptional regulator Fnr [Trinickia dinghuensis]
MFNEATFADDIAPASVPASAHVSGKAASSRPAQQCGSCSMRSACMPQALNAQELSRFDSIVSATRLIKRGDAIYRANDPFQSIYAIRAGSFKTVVMHRDGREQVTGFHLAGEVLGLDGVCTESHSSDAIAIEDSSVCIIPYALLESMCAESKSLQQQVLRMMSGEIVRESSLMMLLGTMSAEQRVAAFLLNLSSRMKARGYSAAEFNLRMTREEMGNFLGMKLETVSRMFSKFQREGLLQTHGKRIRIVNLDALGRV